eukprot:4288732-Pleurochrysis_carterae.AAC.1
MAIKSVWQSKRQMYRKMKAGAMSTIKAINNLRGHIRTVVRRIRGEALCAVAETTISSTTPTNIWRGTPY